MLPGLAMVHTRLHNKAMMRTSIHRRGGGQCVGESSTWRMIQFWRDETAIFDLNPECYVEGGPVC